MMAEEPDATRAIWLKLASVATFVGMAALIKEVTLRVPVGEAVFFRAAFALPVIAAWMAATGGVRTGIRTHDRMGHVFRGVVGTSAMAMGFAGLSLLPFSEVKAIQFASPLLVVIFAAMFLGERVRAFRLAAVVLGLAGVLIILSPRLTALQEGGIGGLDRGQQLGAVLVLASATAAALAQVFVRKLIATETTSAIVFWFSVSAATLSLLTIPWGWVVPSAADAAMLVAAGLAGGLGQILMTSAYRHADAAVIAPFDYASILLALVIGYLWFAEVPTWSMLGGAALVIAGGILVIWRERRLGLLRGEARRGMTPHG